MAKTDTACAAMYGNDDWADLTDNDLDPTPSQPGDFHGHASNEHGLTQAELYDDPLLAVLLGVPIPTTREVTGG